jgi:ribonucleoside-diphosphate reductase alpha chain
MTRQILPSRRRAETFTLQFGNQTVTITLGFYPDNSLGEIFVGVGKTGNDIQAVARDAAVLVSLALQHGVALETIYHAMTRGAAGPASILGAVVDSITTNSFSGSV